MADDLTQKYIIGNPFKRIPFYEGDNSDLIKIANRVLDVEQQEAEQPNTEQEQGSTNSLDKPGFIHVPSINLYFSDTRIHLGKDWHDTHELLKQQGLFMPTPYQFKEFLKYLKDNPNNKNTSLYNEITEVRSPWRANWINARFEEKGNGMYMISENVMEKGIYKTIKVKLKEVLMQDRTPGISLDEWLDSEDPMGLPHSGISNGRLYYWYPRNNSVARLGAYSSRVDLDCCRYPSGSYAPLGVFSVCEANASQQNSGGRE